VCLFVVSASFSRLFGAAVTGFLPASAPHGARAIVVGSGLDAGSAGILFAAGSGTVPASIVSRTATLLEVIVPSTATSGEVRITIDGAPLATFPFTLLPDPAWLKVKTLVASDKGHDVLKQPSGVAASPSGIVYVADTMHHQIMAIQPNGQAAVIAGSGQPGQTDGAAAQAKFKQPGAVVFDPARQVLYVADTANNVIRKIASDGTVSTFAGSGRGEARDGNGTQAGFKSPAGLALDAAGNLYVADSGNDQIRMITPAGVVTTAAGGVHSGFADGVAAQSLFKAPGGVAVTASGVVIIADSGNNRIRQLAAGLVTTIAGTGHSGFVNGAGAVAELSSPSALTIDDGGNIYVADTGNNAIRKITAGLVSTLAGSSKAGYVDGAPAAAQFNQPSGLAFAGALVIADAKNDAVRQILPQLAATDLYPRSGDPAGGTIVRLFGSGFIPGATQVTFGGNAATAITVVSSTELLVTTPPGAIGSVDVTVTTSAGSATLAARYRYQPPFVSLAIAPAGTTLDPAQEQQFTALGVASDNATTDVTASVGWNSSVPAIASISAGGLAHATSPGATTITATLGSLARSVTLIVRNPEPLPPDPATVAPRIDRTVVAPLADEIRFLYSGANAIQTGVAPNAINDDRAAVVRGRLITLAGQPFGGVKVTAINHPEYGQTLTRADGRFDYVINGGGALSLQFSRSGYITAQRLVATSWGDRPTIKDVALVAYDAQSTAVTFGSATNLIARGGAVTDQDGTRRATVIIPAGTTAQLAMPDGSLQPATTLHFRATELTVGANGPKAMPAPLPPSVAYTYCVDLAADEAITAGASSVVFSRPVPFYVDNFANLPVGTGVPSASYDLAGAKWIASDNGVVLRIISITSGAADLDLNGDGVADDASTIGVDAAERQTLATLYTAGKTLWRIPLRHFTAWDFNFSFVLPADAAAPNQQQPYWIPAPSKNDSCGEQNGHSIVNCFTSTLRESIPITGTPFALEYASSRNARTQYSTTIPLTGPSVPSSLQRIELTISIAGQLTFVSLPPQANQSYTYTWDGKDAYGRTLAGAREAAITISYVYPQIYGTTAGVVLGTRWGVLPDVQVGVARSGAQAALSQTFRLTLGHLDATDSALLGGWNFSPQRLYDGNGQTIYDGAGQQRSGDADQSHRGLALTRVAGNGNCCFSGDGGNATDAKLGFPYTLAVAPDGTLYFGESHRIRKVATDGTISTVTTSVDPQWLAVGPDGALYAAVFSAGVVSRVDGNVFARVAGGGQSNVQRPNGVPATDLSISPGAIAAGQDGALYIADSNRILRVAPDGMATTIYGGSSTQFIRPIAVAVGADGAVYASDEHVVHRIGPDGNHKVFAGSTSPQAGTLLDGTPATSGQLPGIPTGLDVAPDGTVVIALSDGVMFGVAVDGTATRLAGTSSSPNRVQLNGLLARAAAISPYDVRVGPDGSVFLPDQEEDVIYKAASVFPSPKLLAPLPSPDGSVAYVFGLGRHTRTVETLTGTTVLTLGYDANGGLTSVFDADSNTTLIERDPTGTPTAIVAPGGQRTNLTIVAGRLTAVTNPANETIQLDYDTQGLLAHFVDGRGGIHTFTYDSNGLLAKDQGPAGGFIAFVRSGNPRSYTVTTTTAEGRSEQYGVQVLADTTARRDHIAPDGTQTHLFFVDGGTNSTSSDGTTTNSRTTADARFGMRAPISGASTVVAGGHTMRFTHTQSVTPSAVNPLAVASVTDALSVNGRTWTTTYDGATRTALLTSPEGRPQTSIADERGRLVSFAQPGIAPASIGYNAFGSVGSITQENRTSSLSYDNRRLLTGVSDAIGRTTGFAYDTAGRMTDQTRPDGRVVHLTYDASGNITSVSPPTRPSHGFSFTPENLTSTYTPPAVPSGGATQYAYNLDRQPISVLRPDGKTISLGYDAGARLSSLTISRGVYKYDYNGAGQLDQITAPDGGKIALGYSGPLLTSATWSGALQASISFDYDNDFRLTSETAAGVPVTFGYDGDGLLTSAGAFTLQRDPLNGLPTASTLASITDQWSYNTFGEPASYAASFGATPLFSEQLTRNAAGQITQKSESVVGATKTYTYDYDGMGRLSSVAPDSGDPVTYGYDDNGNRTSRSAFAASETGSYDDQDRLLAYGRATYTYTANGELATKTDASGTTTYNIDEVGNLLSVTLPAGAEIDYLLDGQNRRVAKTVTGTMTRQWIWSGSLRIAAELDGTGALVSRFVYGTRTNLPDFMIRGGTTYRIITDHLGSVRLVVDVATGTVAQRLDYDEFGRVLGDSNPGFQPLGFAGGMYDPDTGLVRFGSRDYEPQTGRWTAKDAIGFEGGDSDLYSYVGNDPINFIDPTGFDAITADPHALSAMAALFRRSLSDPNHSEWSAILYKGGDDKIYCKSLGSRHTPNANRSDVPKGLPDEVLVHTHPRGRTEFANDPGDTVAANKLNMPSYVLSAAGIHKLIPNGRNGTESTELDNRTYLHQNGRNWYDYTDQDSCGCAGLR
jgi:RHS repeat-associated protein